MNAIAVSDPQGWARACSSAFVPLRVHAAQSAFRAELDQRVLGPGVALTRVASGASKVYRSTRVVHAHPRDDVLISLHRQGTGVVTQCGRSVALRAGGATIYDASMPYSLAFPGRMSETVVQLPRRRLERTGCRIGDIVARELPVNPALAALTALATVPSERSSPNRLEDEAIADSLVSLAVAVMSAAVVSGDRILPADILRSSARQFIDDCIGDHGLCPERVAVQLNVSLRRLQKLFAEESDSPAGYIRRRRLERGRQLLLGGHPVGRVAYAVGFNDIDTFRRAFKRHYGHVPSSLGG